MDLLRGSNVDGMAKHAVSAWQAGRRVFICQLRAPMAHSPDLSRPVPGIAEMVEAVENAGWWLDKMTMGIADGKVTMYCLFRRRQ